jgi:carboxylesterase
MSKTPDIKTLLQTLKLFPGPEHQPFDWAGGPAAALLVHGFPGTTADMRAAGESLHRAGWTVRGLLLPGFGPDMANMLAYTEQDWLAAVTTALAELQQTHRPVLLIGHSMGAALAMQAAAVGRPDGLILLSPFWQLGEWWQRWLALALKPFFPYVYAFRYANLSDPVIRQEIISVMPDINLDDPATQQRLRSLPVPIAVFEQMMKTGQAAYRLAPQLTLPTLVVQGAQDDTVKVGRTRQLIKRLPGLRRYHEVNSGHILVRASDPAWPEVEREVLAFAADFWGK